MMPHYWATFVELIRIPFAHVELIWGIVPLYFAWALNELTSSKATYRTAIQTHALHWTWDRLAAICLFAVPLWFLLHFGLMPVRNEK
jgi:hypothetical protein